MTLYYCLPSVLLLLYSYLLGNMIMEKHRLDIVSSKLLTGGIASFAAFYVCLIPFMMLDDGFNAAVCLICILFILSFCYSLLYFVRQEGFRSVFGKIKKSQHIIFIWLTIFAIAIIIAFVTVRFESDADDSYYVSEVASMIENRQFYAVEAPSGKYDVPFEDQYRLIGYEPLIAVLCIVFRFNPATMMHTSIVPYIMTLGFLAIYSFAKELSAKNDLKLFLFTVCFFAFSGRLIYTPAPYLFFLPWFGRSILNYVNYIVLATFFLKLIRRKKCGRKDVIELSFLMISSFGLAATGIYLMPLCYVAFGITFVLSVRDWKEVLKLTIPGWISLPIVMLKFYVMTNATILDKLTAGTEELNYKSIVYSNLGGWIGILLILFFMAFIAIMGECHHRLFCILYPVICFFTFLNPLLCQFMAKNITGTSVYQRLLFGLFYYLFPTVCYSIILDRIHVKRLQRLAVLFLFFLVVGKPALELDSYAFSSNVEKLDDASIKIGDVMNEIALSSEGDYHPTLFVPEPYSLEIRQYTGKPILIWHRYAKMEYRQKDDLESWERLCDLYSALYGAEKLDDTIISSLRSFETDFVAIPIEKDNLGYKDLYAVVYENEKYRIYDIRSE